MSALDKDNMKKIAVGLAACCLLLRAGAAEVEWMTDLAKAQAKAKEEKKVVMLDFTGSDWCGWCIKLNKDVFSQPEFIEYAKKNLVAVEVDFPRRKEQAADVKKANAALGQKYHVDGYPTIVLLDASGKELGDPIVGYVSGGPKAFIAKLQELKGKS
jgi:protein disulfide-isomerase